MAIENNPIFDRLPNNLFLSRNSYAVEKDRWRIVNRQNGESLPETAAATAEECMLKYLTYEEAERAAWTGSGSTSMKTSTASSI